MKKSILFVAALLAAATAFAQGKITGTVTNSDAEPVIGATVVVKGTNRGTSTDSRGRYSIDAAKGDVLVFSYVGMIGSEIPVRNSPPPPVH